jgi:hypothetical protein
MPTALKSPARGRRLPSPAPNAQVAEQQNQGMSDAVNVRRGFGFVLIDGEPVARPGGKLNVTGARPGVDGLYGIEIVEHYFTTCVTLYRPQGEASGCGGWQTSRATKPEKSTNLSTDSLRPKGRKKFQDEIPIFAINCKIVACAARQAN